MDHISVCICTYKRAGLLSDLLIRLQNQLTNNSFSFSVVVVDNDILKSGEAAVLSVKRELSIEVEYHVEAIQSIALARNKAVKNARGNLIAFIDDDEIPEKHWLFKLHRALHTFKADAVEGPVIPYYEGTPPKWVIQGKFYERPIHKTGFIIGAGEGRTGNILIKKDVFTNTGELFDPRFGSGSEDRDFIRRMIRQGFVFVWCNEARVFEYVPPVRLKREFMIRRALLRGQVSLARPGRAHILAFKSLLAIPVYTMALPVLLMLGHHWFMQYLVKDFDHIGRILSLMKVNIIKEKYIIA